MTFTVNKFKMVNQFLAPGVRLPPSGVDLLAVV